ncbi:MAG: hypothetical protein ABI618_19020, partial [Nitrospirota bacterium]
WCRHEERIGRATGTGHPGRSEVRSSLLRCAGGRESGEGGGQGFPLFLWGGLLIRWCCVWLV